MAHRGETDRMQPVVLGNLILNPLLQRPRLVGGKRHERFGGVYELTSELAVRIPCDAAARRLRRGFRDVPLRQRGGIEHVLMASAAQDATAHWRPPVPVRP